MQEAYTLYIRGAMIAVDDFHGSTKQYPGINSHLKLEEYQFDIGFLIFRLLLETFAEDMEEST